MAHPKVTQLQKTLSRTFRIPVRQHHITVYPQSGRCVFRMYVVRKTAINTHYTVSYSPHRHALIFQPPNITFVPTKLKPIHIKVRARNNLAFFSKAITKAIARKYPQSSTTQALRLRFVGLPQISSHGIITWSLSTAPVTDITSITTDTKRHT